MPTMASRSRAKVDAGEVDEATLLHEMLRRGAKNGLATLCFGGSRGIALTVER
jgi:acetyl-CoA acetyltransferase